MVYTVKLTRTVAESIISLHPDIKKQIKIAVKELSVAPYTGKELQEELSGFLSYRFKRYRIIYQVNDQDKVLTIFMLGHRRDVYELFSEIIKYKKGQ